MNASRASAAAARQRGVRFAARPAVLLAGLLALAAGPAALRAQEPQAPISLFPPTVTGPAPEEALPPAAGEVPSAPSENAGETLQYEGIEVDRLGELDADALGILGAENGGFGSDAWAGSPRAQVAALLRRLPEDPASPSLRSLITRLLLSSARAPAATPSGTGLTVAEALAAAQGTAVGGSDFLRLRAERLYAMGELAGLNRLLGMVPQRVEDPWLATARVEGLLLAGRDLEACGQVPAGLARYPQTLFWAKAQVYCQFVAEQTDQALLGADLLREQAPDSDPTFFALVDSLVSGTAAAPAGAELSPLNLAMLRRSGGALSLDDVAGAGPLALHGIAALTGGDHAVHVGAVERLVEVGALPGERLAGAYSAFEFTEAELGDALGEAERTSGPRSRGLLFRATQRESLAATRAEILRAAFLSAEADGRANALARAALPLMAELPPTPELAWFAPQAARSLFRIGQFERAGAWLSVLRVDGLKNPESQAAYEALQPLRRLAGGGEPLAAEPEGAAADARLLLLVLSRALGQEEAAWLDLAQGEEAAPRPLPRLASLLALADAAAEGRRGETVLLAATALGAAAPGDSHPLALGYAVSALTAVGLGNEARALAIEAALAAGI